MRMKPCSQFRLFRRMLPVSRSRRIVRYCEPSVKAPGRQPQDDCKVTAQPFSAHPEPVEGWSLRWLMVRQAHHERMEKGLCNRPASIGPPEAERCPLTPAPCATAHPFPTLYLVSQAASLRPRPNARRQPTAEYRVHRVQVTRPTAAAVHGSTSDLMHRWLSLTGR